MWKRVIHIHSGQDLWTGKLDLCFGDKFFRTPGLQVFLVREEASLFSRGELAAIDGLWGICQCCNEYEEPLPQFQNSSVTRYAANAAT
jgi:hypothetical protein